MSQSSPDFESSSQDNASYLAALTCPIYLLHEFIGWVLLNRLPEYNPLFKLLTVIVIIFALSAAVHVCEKRLAGWLKAKLPA